ncbi:YqzK family protein [Bacillus kwashiorkori]|uniref:YqzK family protein n=1 Tax=Bacillus kwashiorkori TaxID=1522318 RepID=UPI0007835B21|nr:YqzK family protein [Bacillus kwashiorkori]
MKKYVKLILQTLKVFILFTGCTILFYYAILWVNEEYQNHQRYKEPEGKAIRVVSYEKEEDYNWYERILLFYLDGE